MFFAYLMMSTCYMCIFLSLQRVGIDMLVLLIAFIVDWLITIQVKIYRRLFIDLGS